MRIFLMLSILILIVGCADLKLKHSCFTTVECKADRHAWAMTMKEAYKNSNQRAMLYAYLDNYDSSWKSDGTDLKMKAMITLEPTRRPVEVKK
jgi:hypothetical protein